MPYLALACDSDGTLTRRQRLARRTADALRRLRASGRRIILVTGEVCDDYDHLVGTGLFDRVVGENGAVLGCPGKAEDQPLAGPPPPPLVRALRRRHVRPLTVGRVMVATKRPHDRALVEAISELGLDWRVV